MPTRAVLVAVLAVALLSRAVAAECDGPYKDKPLSEEALVDEYWEWLRERLNDRLAIERQVEYATPQ